MFERFTDQAKRSVMLAQEAARDLSHAYVGTEHLLLGLVANHAGVAHRALDLFEVTWDRTRTEVAELVGVGTQGPVPNLPFTSSAKGALERAQWEARQLRDDRIGTQHLLLGLVRPADTSAAKVLESLAVEPDVLREAVLQLVGAGIRDLPADAELVAGSADGGADSAGAETIEPEGAGPAGEQTDPGDDPILVGSARRPTVAEDRILGPADIATELHRLADEVAQLRTEVTRLSQQVEPRGGWRRR